MCKTKNKKKVEKYPNNYRMDILVASLKYRETSLLRQTDSLLEMIQLMNI